MPLNVQDLARQMTAAAAGQFKKQWPDVKSYAESEFQKLAHAIVFIGEERVAGQIDETEGALLLDMQKNASRAVFLTIKGIGLLTAEAAVNAALDVVRTAVNTALGLTLL